MELNESIAQPSESIRFGLDDEQVLGCRLNLSFPAIDRFHLGNDIDARGQLTLNQCAGDGPCFFE
jgi:hypothetical protein